MGEQWTDFLEYLLPRLFPNCNVNFVSGVSGYTTGNTTYPNIKAALNEHKRQAPLLVRETDPNLAVHQQTMV
jgi:hypothetical protein